ncbi:MAG: methyltransferase domain-containing protein [Proteobacteria bacterium]|nr:methyltransferase domain-containing protein [Pseudomonadota bacterium]
MHESSFEKARIFLEQYKSEMPSDRPIKVLEVGSKSYHDQDTYRGLFPSPEYIYTGLDIEAGNNVDIVPANPFIWDEIATSSFDFCVSGQTFEHNPYFWVTFAEISRVLLPGGLTLIIAPGAGPVHRYPVDCWRFYPDSWAALCTLTEMELVECYFETDEMSAIPGGKWRDSCVLARKPHLSEIELERSHKRLEKLVALFRDEHVRVVQSNLTPGKGIKAYRAEMARKSPLTLRKKIKTRLSSSDRIHSF